MFRFKRNPKDIEEVQEKEPLLSNGDSHTEENKPTIEDALIPSEALPELPKMTNSGFTFFSNVTWFEFYLLFIGALGALVQGFMPLGFYFYFGKLVNSSSLKIKFQY